MNNALNRALLLLQQNRFQLAEQELRQILALNPDQAIAHAYLALSLSAQKKHQPATQEAQQAVHLEPDVAYCHYVLGRVLSDQKRFRAAEAAAHQAIRLDPAEADFFALLGHIHLAQQRWSEALETVEKGLRLDPEHVECQNLQAIALKQMNRKFEAGVTLNAALARDPDNAITHANQGWLYLQMEQHEEAMKHFGEALRLEPQLEWARTGIVTSLKSRRLIYRLVLRYFFWMSRQGRKWRWAIILGLYFLYRAGWRVAQTNPGLAPFINPLLILYIVFVYLSWTADTLFNLLLRLDPFGRLALSDDEITASNWTAACLLGALLGLATWLATRNGVAITAALYSAFMVIPIGGTFRAESGSQERKTLTGLTLILAALALLALGLGFVNAPLAGTLSLFFFLGILIFSFAANALISRSR
jgi:tetratricopeptide (TPR) repeat protein